MEVQGLRIRPTIVTTLCLLCLASSASGRDIAVPGELPTLHQALKIADRGDRIVLRPGRHDGSLLDLAEGVTILGDRDDPGSVIIDASGSDRVFRAESIQLARIVGVTIIGGQAHGATSYSSSGGGLFVSSSRVDLEAVHFIDNSADAAGGCIRVSNGEVVIEDCRFIDGRATKGGGAVDLSYNSIAQIRDSVFRGNSAAWGGAISARTGSSVWIDDSTFLGNAATQPQELGGAFYADYAAQVAFTRCVLADNSARQGGGALLGDAISSFVNCTLAGNTASDDGGAFFVRGGSLLVDHAIVAFNEGSALTSESGQIYVRTSDIFGNLGGDWDGVLADLRDQHGNLEVDPLFCGTGDFHLQDDSPCAAANSPAGLIGALEVGCQNFGIQLQNFRAALDRREILLTWQVAGGEAFEYRVSGRSRTHPEEPVWWVDYVADDLPGNFRAVDEPADDLGTLEYTLDARAPGGDWVFLGDAVVTMADTSVPEALVLDRVYPNPFNPRVNIQFTLGERVMVEASIYDIHGRIVFPILRGVRAAGTYTTYWNGVAEHGRQAPTGTYILRIKTADKVITHKLVMVK